MRVSDSMRGATRFCLVFIFFHCYGFHEVAYPKIKRSSHSSRRFVFFVWFLMVSSSIVSDIDTILRASEIVKRSLLEETENDDRTLQVEKSMY